MAIYNTTNILVTATTTSSFSELENAAGFYVVSMGTSPMVIFTYPEGGPNVVVNVPIVHKIFDTGFQSS